MRKVENQSRGKYFSSCLRVFSTLQHLRFPLTQEKRYLDRGSGIGDTQKRQDLRIFRSSDFGPCDGLDVFWRGESWKMD